VTSSPTRSAPLGPAVLMILGSCTSLQFGAALAAHLFPALGSWGTTTVRLGIAALVLLVLVRPAAHRWTRAQWRSVLGFGLAMGAMNGFFYAAIERIPLGTAVAFEFLGPLVLSAILSRRAADLMCVVLALMGIGLFGAESLAGFSGLDPLGVLFALIAAVFWGTYVLASARVGRDVPGQGGLAVAVGIGALAVAPLGAGGVVTAVAHPSLLLLGTATALLASVLPYTLELAALRRLPRNVFGILLSLEPAIATIAGAVLLSQVPSAYGIGAVVLVVAASAGTTLTAQRAARRERAAAAGQDEADEDAREPQGAGSVGSAQDPEGPAVLAVQSVAEPEAVTGEFLAPAVEPVEAESGPEREGHVEDDPVAQVEHAPSERERSRVHVRQA
jgi:inner membrane transporter RhtA